MPLPDFTSPTLFPPFTSLPTTTTTTTTTTTPSPNESPPSSSSSEEGEYHLLAQIHHNMTLTKPTLICTDHTNTSFAVVFNSRPASGPDTLDLSRLGYRRGATLVLPRAKRTPPKEGDGSRGFVGITREEEGGVRVVPTTAGVAKVKEGEGGDGMGMGAGGTEGLERVLRVGGWLRERDGEREGGKVGRGCDSCGGETRKDGGGGEGEKAALMKCTGCGEVEYCCKECQTKGWNEGGHKADCKVIKAIRAIWP